MLGREVVELQKAKATIKDMGTNDTQLEVAVASLRDHPGYWVIKMLLMQRMVTEVSMGDKDKFAGGIGLAMAILVSKVEVEIEKPEPPSGDEES